MHIHVHLSSMFHYSRRLAFDLHFINSKSTSSNENKQGLQHNSQRQFQLKVIIQFLTPETPHSNLSQTTLAKMHTKELYMANSHKKQSHLQFTLANFITTLSQMQFWHKAMIELKRSKISTHKRKTMQHHIIISTIVFQCQLFCTFSGPIRFLPSPS